MKRKIVKIKLEGKDYGMVMDFDAAIEFQDLAGMSIFKGLDAIAQTQDIVILGYFLAATLKDENGKAVGIDFVKDLDIFESLETFMGAFEELVSNSLDKNNNKNFQKKKKKKI